METDKKSEFKDYSLSQHVLIDDLKDEQINKIFGSSKKICAKKNDDEPIIVERFVDAAIELSQRGRTENNAITYKTSNDPRIDFYFKLLEDTDEASVVKLLESSWNYNSLDTLRLIANLRDIRNGEGIRYQYYVCLNWIYLHHPRTLLQNFQILIECGYWKDPLQLIIVILFNGKIAKYLFADECNRSKSHKLLVEQMKNLKKIKSKTDESSIEIESVHSIKRSFYGKVKSDLNGLLVEQYREEINKKYRPLVEKKKECCGSKSFEEEETEKSGHSEKYEKHALYRNRNANEIDRKYMKELIIRHARERYNNDAKYRYFHIEFAKIIARQLIDDLNNLKNGDTKNISLAAKWAPSLNGHFYKYSLICSSIALQIAKLTRENDKSIEEIFNKPIPIANYLARKNYVKNYICKLREHLRIPESYMCKNEWHQLPYQMVASKCMQKNRQLFINHDLDRFREFVKSREKISGSTLKPPELVKRVIDLKNLVVKDDKFDLELELLEKQWNSLKDSIQTARKDTCFRSALAVCDVSGSMSGTPMNAAIGLTLMTMSFAGEPWSNLCLTFSHEPSFVSFDKNDTFFNKVSKLLDADAGLNTDISKTFQLILNLAKKNNLQQNEIPKYLFIFTDMEFDEADQAQTNFEEAKRLGAIHILRTPKILNF